MIDILGLAEVIIDITVRYHSIYKSIVTDQGLLFISKFWFLLYYFLKIKKNYLQISIYNWIAKLRDKIV